MVQSFLVEETKELIYDSEKIEEWKAKCEELGLEGQLGLAVEDKSPMPFTFMNVAMQRVYETICPAKVNYKTYNKTAIPLEVLSLIALSEKEKYFTKIEIWYDDKTPDPIAVGFIQTHKEYTWMFDSYLIARWGDELKPFKKLKAEAVEIYKRTSSNTLKKTISQATMALSNIDLNTDMYFDAQINSHEALPF